MEVIEITVDNVNMIEAEFDQGQSNIDITANFNPVIEVKDFNYPQELVLVNQRIAQILQSNGKLVEWNKSDTHIQYRYAGDADWINLVALTEIKGSDGYTPQKGTDYVDGENGITPQKGVDYFDGEDGITPQKGVDYFDGQNVEFQKSATHIQWRIVGSVTWLNLVLLTDLKGDQGAPTTRAGLGLAITDTPEFANVFNTALNTTAETGGEITPTLWAWIQSVYSSIVAKSVKSNIIGIWTYLFGVIPTKQDKLTLLATEETTTFTLALTHLDKVVPCNSNIDMIVNIPLNNIVGFEIGTAILIKQRGLGVITATAISGVTLLGGPKTQGQYKVIALYKEAINTWTVIGGTA